MKLSTRSTYGIRALIELALASGHGPISATLIAKRQDLSVAYLEQLLHRLKKDGLVKSVRGPRGGYVLAREPQRITMAQVVGVLDGNNGAWNSTKTRPQPRRASKGAIAVVSPIAGPGRGLSSRIAARDGRRHAQWIADAVWRCVHERIVQSLDAVTLQDLCDEVRATAGEPLDHRYVFHI